MLAGALAAAGFGLFWGLQRPVVEAKRFYEHVQKGNTKRAYAMTCPELREKLDRQELRELLENEMRVYRARSFEVTGVNVRSGAPSCVRGTVVTRGGDRLNASVFLDPSQDYCVIALFSGTADDMCER